MDEHKFRVYWVHPESSCSGFDYFDAIDGYKLGDTAEIVGIDQFIGLNDKNGTEIYSGDIVKEPKFGFTRVVKYEELDQSDDMACPGIGYQFSTEPSEMEVVGNIYEKEKEVPQ